MTFSAEKILKTRSTVGGCCATGVFCILSVCGANAMQAPGSSTQAPPLPIRVQDGGTVPAPAVVDPVTPAKGAAKAATVILKDKKLTVEASDSDLSGILKEIANISGMSLDGLGSSVRVFGVYGPGNPQEVLAGLLAGSGYNFMMVGSTADGAPRKLLLTAKSGDSPQSSAIESRAAAPSENSTVNAESPLGPGAIAHVPPAESQDAPDNDDRVQQNLQRLKQMHEQMQQRSTQQ